MFTFVTAKRYVVQWREDVPYAQSYPDGTVLRGYPGHVVNIDDYEPERVDTQQQGV